MVLLFFKTNSLALFLLQILSPVCLLKPILILMSKQGSKPSSSISPLLTVSQHPSPFYFSVAENSLDFHSFLNLNSLKTWPTSLLFCVNSFFFFLKFARGLRVTPCICAALLEVLVTLAFGIYLQNHFHTMISRPPSLVNSVLNLFFGS